MSRPKQRRGQPETGGTQPNAGQTAEKSNAAATGQNGPRAPERTLTRAEKALLAVLLNPKYYKSMDKERWTAAGISRRRFYEIIADPWFREQQHQAFMDWLRRDLAPIMDAHIETARMPGKEGFFDRRMAFEMSGYYQEQKRIEHKKLPTEDKADPSRALEARLDQLAARVTQQEEKAATPPAPPPAQPQDADRVEVRPN